jgi:hypothetical protein
MGRRSMKRLPEIRLPFDHRPDELDAAVARCGVLHGVRWRVLKKSLDARHKKNIVFVYSIGLPEPSDERVDSPQRRRFLLH